MWHCSSYDREPSGSSSSSRFTSSYCDSDEDNSVIQELLQLSEIEQTNKQKIFIENSKDVAITTSDTDVDLNIQVLVQILVAITAIIYIF